MTKKLIGAQRLINICEPIVESLSPVLAYCQKCTCPVASAFLQCRHKRLQPANQIGHGIFCHVDQFPVLLLQPSHILLFAAHLLNCSDMLVSNVFGNLKSLWNIENTEHILTSFVETRKRYAADPYCTFSVHLGSCVVSGCDQFSYKKRLGHILYNW